MPDETATHTMRCPVKGCPGELRRQADASAPKNLTPTFRCHDCNIRFAVYNPRSFSLMIAAIRRVRRACGLDPIDGGDLAIVRFVEANGGVACVLKMKFSDISAGFKKT